MFDDLTQAEAELLEEALSLRMDIFWDESDRHGLALAHRMHEELMEEYDRPNHY